MLLAPQPEEERAIDTRQLLPAMQPGMAAAAHCDLPRRFVRARAAMVDEQRPVGETHLTAAVPPEHLLAETAESVAGVPPAIIIATTQSVRDEHRLAADPAPPGRLLHRSGSPAPLPCPAAAASTRIEASGNPLSSAASRSWRSNQVELRDESCGRSQTPAQS